MSFLLESLQFRDDSHCRRACRRGASHPRSHSEPKDRASRPSSSASRRTAACPTRAAASRSASPRGGTRQAACASPRWACRSRGRQRFLVDATPDFAAQMESTRRPPRRNPPDARPHRALPGPGAARPRGPRRPRRPGHLHAGDGAGSCARISPGAGSSRRATSRSARSRRESSSRSRQPARQRRSAFRTATRTPTRWPSSSGTRDAHILWLPDIDKWEKWDRTPPRRFSRIPRCRVRRRHVLLGRRNPRPLDRGDPSSALVPETRRAWPGCRRPAAASSSCT